MQGAEQSRVEQSRVPRNVAKGYHTLLPRLASLTSPLLRHAAAQTRLWPVDETVKK